MGDRTRMPFAATRRTLPQRPREVFTDMQRILDVLKQYWGYDSLRPLQGEAMASVIEGRDSLTVLPTGGGKSLCFQAPAVAMEGMAVVVSPLIALMKDQVDALQANGVAAACINSSLSNSERYAVDAAIRAGALKLLYVTPERLVQPRFIAYLQRFGVSFIAIDEAHCISMWGHDFRPEYRGISVLKEQFPGIAVHAYTATATPQVRNDIIQQLNLDAPDVHVGDFDRPNLNYKVRQRSDRMGQLTAVIDTHPGESGVVYAISRKDVEEIAAALNQRGYRAIAYHAGMGDHDRKTNQEAFLREEVDIIVATVAFGMGIDKSNVRYVVHAAMPKSLEHYQQESGRAGRDGLEADCVLLYSGGDFGLWSRILQNDEGEGSAIAAQKLRDMFDYCGSVACRHATLVQYFGQPWTKAKCGACDVCNGEIETMAGAEEIAQFICRAVQGVEQRFGAQYVAGILAGKADARVHQNGHDDLPEFGKLGSHTQRAVRGWIEQLVAQGYLEKAGEYGVLQLTANGDRVLRGEPDVPVVLTESAPSKRGGKRAAAAAGADWEGVDRELFEALRTLRRETAQAQGKPPYIVFGDRSLRDLARKRPSSAAALLAVHGVGRQKAKDYGETFLAAIMDYCSERGMAMDVGLDAGFEMAAPASARTKPTAKDFAFDLFRSGCSIADVCEQTARAETTVSGYLAEFIEAEGRTDGDPWVDAATVARVYEAVQTVGMEKLKPIHSQLNGEVDYTAIRIAVACIQNASDEAAAG